MIEGLKPYPKYKDAELATLGAIPSHWVERRAKYLFREVDERSETGGEEMLSVSHKTGVTPRSQKNVTMFMAESNVGHKLCRPDDVVINTMWAWMAALGVSRHTGLVSPAYGVYRPKPGAPTLSSKYVDALLRTEAYRTEYVCRSTGINSSRLRLYPEMFLRIPILVPPPDEQAAIVKFLDHADRQINRYIRAKRKLIALHNEQKQAIIHLAVTRGLDPNVKLKPSGVEWLGDVPEQWEVTRLKQCITTIEQGWSPQCDAQPATEMEWGVLKVGCVNRECFDPTQNKKLPETLAEEPALEIQDGDILVSRANTRELLGLAALAVNPRKMLMLCDKLFRFRAIAKVANARFLVYAIRSRNSRAQIETRTNGASDSMQNIGQSVVNNLWIPLPPISVQVEIVREIEQRTAQLSRSLGIAEREISVLREYRARLVADVVTGKLDVRAAGAKLPEITDDQDAGPAENEEFDDDEASPDDDTIADAAE